jgi:23S rRNA (uracil-5-)-methyltransferase RumA
LRGKEKENMKKGQIYEGIIERVDFPNKCRIPVPEEKKTILVKGGIPGQKVQVAIQKIRKDRAEGRILEVLEKAPNEIEPACPHFGKCGGCTYQNLPYDEQLKLKEQQVKSLLDSVCDDYTFEGIKASPVQSEYRNKMEFSFGDEFKDGPLALGMHKKGSFYDLVTVSECTIVDGDYRKILKCTLDYFAELGGTYYHRLRHEGFLRHLLVRKGAKTGEILIDLITSHQNELDCQGWKERLLALELDGTIAGILHTYNDSVADVVKDEGTEILYGKDYFYEEILGLKFRISPFSFFQTNSLGAEVLYSTARDYIGDTKGKVVFDLYSGTGTIAQILAPVAEKVVGVEIVEEAVEAARVNAKLNGLDNCSFIAGDVLKVLDTIEEKPDLIVLDPPRDGINPKALGKIIRYGVDRLIYISCKPTSLVRDLESFLKYGYRMEKAVAIDQFPGTVHVESVVLLSRE